MGEVMGTVDEVFAAAMALPPSDRLTLAGRLFEALHETDSETELDDELQRTVATRIAAYRRGETQSFDADEVLDELENSLDEGTLQ
jgi:putative addiction module component (TIGR02574 family)